MSTDKKTTDYTPSAPRSGNKKGGKKQAEPIFDIAKDKIPSLDFKVLTSSLSQGGKVPTSSQLRCFKLDGKIHL